VCARLPVQVTNMVVVFKKTGIAVLMSSKKGVYFRPLTRNSQRYGATRRSLSPGTQLAHAPRGGGAS